MHSQTNASSGKWMSNRQRTTPIIPFVHVWQANFAIQANVIFAEPIGVHCFQICTDLSLKPKIIEWLINNCSFFCPVIWFDWWKTTYSKCLMNFPWIDIGHFQASFFQNLWNTISWSQQQLIDWILRHICEIANVCFWFEAQFFGFCLSHNQTGRRTISLYGEPSETQIENVIKIKIRRSSGWDL